MKIIKDFLDKKGIKYFIAGSVALGVESSNSDVDICISEKDAITLKIFFIENNYDIKEDYSLSVKEDSSFTGSSYKVSIDNLPCDFIGLTDSDYLLWREAVNTMQVWQERSDKTLFKNKPGRVMVFMALRDLLRKLD